MLGGREVELFTADEGEDATTSAPAAEKLVTQDRVEVLAGTISSGASGGVAQVATRERIPFVGANGRPKIDDSTWVWHTSFLTEDFGAALGQYMAEAIDGPVYVMGQDFVGAYEGMRGFLRAFGEAGGVLANPDGAPTLTPMSTTDYVPFLVRDQGNRRPGGVRVVRRQAGGRLPEAVPHFSGGRPSVVRQRRDRGHPGAAGDRRRRDRCALGVPLRAEPGQPGEPRVRGGVGRQVPGRGALRPRGVGLRRGLGARPGPQSRAVRTPDRRRSTRRSPNSARSTARAASGSSARKPTRRCRSGICGRSAGTAAPCPTP